MFRLRTLVVIVVIITLLSIVASWRLHSETGVLFPPKSRRPSSASSPQTEYAPPSSASDAEEPAPLLSPSATATILIRGDPISTFFGDADSGKKQEKATRRILLGFSRGDACSVAEIFRDVARFSYFTAFSSPPLAQPLPGSCQAAFPMKCRAMLSGESTVKGVVLDWFFRAVNCKSIADTIAFVDIEQERDPVGPRLLIPSQQLIVDTRDAVEFLRLKFWRSVSALSLLERQVAPQYALRSSSKSKSGDPSLLFASTNVVILAASTSSADADAARTASDFLRESFSPLVSVTIVDADLISNGTAADYYSTLVTAHVVLFLGGSSTSQQRLRSAKLQAMPLLVAGTVVLDAVSCGGGDFELEALAEWLSLDYSQSLKLFELFHHPKRSTDKSSFESYFTRGGSSETDGNGGTGAFVDAKDAPRSLQRSQRLVQTFRNEARCSEASPGPDTKALFSAMHEALVSSYARRYRFSNLRVFDMRRN